jgi:hypothetical protein
MKLFQSDNNGSHKVTLLPIFFGRLRVFVMAIGVAITPDNMMPQPFVQKS